MDIKNKKNVTGMRQNPSVIIIGVLYSTRRKKKTKDFVEHTTSLIKQTCDGLTRTYLLVRILRDLPQEVNGNIIDIIII